MKKSITQLLLFICLLPLAALSQDDLHAAIVKNDLATFRKMLSAGSDVNAREAYGASTPLITAALFGRTDMARLLIDAGAKINLQNNDGSTALITAAFFCRPDIVQLLLSKKADRNIVNKYGQTALQSVTAPFQEVKQVYDMLGNALAPMGLQLDYNYIRQTRPVIADKLKH